jgi:hypothetical protein
LYINFILYLIYDCGRHQGQSIIYTKILASDLHKEVPKVLRRIMANSIRKKQQFSLEILSKNLNEALKDPNNALKSQPQLLL